MTTLVTRLDQQIHHSTRLWSGAAMGALALHLTLAALLITTFQSNDVSDLGAPGLMIGLDLSSPNREAIDLPPGPDSDASAASPSVVEQKAVVKESAQPKDTSPETENPARIVTKSNSTKPEEDDPNVKAKQQSPSAESVASEATAAPSLAAVPESNAATTIDQGSGENKQRLRSTWAKELVAHLDRHKKYPADRVRQSGCRP